MANPPTDYYRLLGVHPSASTEELRRAYRARARSLHPDVRGASPEADSRMAELNAAWAVLRDPAARSGYDRSLQLGTPAAGGSPGFAADERGTAQARSRPAPSAAHARERGSRVLAVGRLMVALALAGGAPVAAFGFASGAPTLVAAGFAMLLTGAVGTATLVLLAMRPSRARVRRGGSRRMRRRRRRRSSARSSPPRRRSR
jgi:curved DNA-binding protein CbpA